MGWIKVEDGKIKVEDTKVEHGKTSKLRVAMAGREDPKPVMVMFVFLLNFKYNFND